MHRSFGHNITFTLESKEMDRSSACSSSSFSFDGQRVSMFLKADLLMSLNMHLILQPTLLQHQHFPSSSISWDKSLLLPLPSAPSQSNPIQRPQTHQCFFVRTREKIPGTDLRQMLEQGPIFCSPVAVLAIDVFSWLQNEKEEKGKNVF